MLGFAFGLALLTGILFGAAPAWFATRTDPIDALRGAGRTTGHHGAFTRKALVVVHKDNESRIGKDTIAEVYKATGFAP